MKSTQVQVYKLYTYGLWSDPEGGKYVNDVYAGPEIRIEVRPKTYNKGTAQEFTSWEPSDSALNRAVGATRRLTWEGEAEYTLYATDSRGDPACELRRVK